MKTPTTGTVVCSTGRITAGNGSYKIMLATDRNPQMALTIDAKNAKIQAPSAAKDTSDRPILAALVVLVTGGMGWGLSSLSKWLDDKLFHCSNDRGKSSVELL